MSTMKDRKSVPVRFWPKVDKTDRCWLWNASKSHDGYGMFYVRSADDRPIHAYAHRVAYELLVGPIPEGMQLDHLCRVRSCVNPAHLDPVTPQENMARSNGTASWALRTGRCKRGHSYSDAYTTKNGSRACRTCILERGRRRKSARQQPMVSS